MHRCGCCVWGLPCDVVRRIFILSPAHCGGERAQLAIRPQARFELALKLREAPGATVAETFTFLSGLYFRGKMAYVNAFAAPLPPVAACGALVITTNRGMICPNTFITSSDLGAMGTGDIDESDASYRAPMERDAAALAEALGPSGKAILLGSVATGKYCDILLSFLGRRLLFPQEFVGRGDMSRGGLMLRCARDCRELTYVPVLTAVRRGARPPRLEPVSWKNLNGAASRSKEVGSQKRKVKAPKPRLKRSSKRG